LPGRLKNRVQLEVVALAAAGVVTREAVCVAAARVVVEGLLSLVVAAADAAFGDFLEPFADRGAPSAPATCEDFTESRRTLCEPAWHPPTKTATAAAVTTSARCIGELPGRRLREAAKNNPLPAGRVGRQRDRTASKRAV
jgi:hypothetical protein